MNRSNLGKILVVVNIFTKLHFFLINSEVDIQAQLTLNQSRIEEITMKEDIVTVGLIGDDGFGDIPFDDNEKEILRAGSAADDSLFTSKDQSRLITIDEPNETKDTKDNLLDSKLGMWLLLLFCFDISGLEIHNGHVAVAVDSPGHCCNAPRIVYDLWPQMACPFSVCCCHVLRNRCENIGCFLLISP